MRFLGNCCTDPTFCNDLFMNHNIETRYQTGEDQRDAVLRHELDGLCILQPGVVSFKYFCCGCASMMHLSYEACALLLSTYKVKWLSLSIFRSCCAAVGFRTDGTSYGLDLPLKLRQCLTHWGPLCDCEGTLGMISCFESSRSSGTLGFSPQRLFGYENDLCDAIVCHLVFGQCRGSSAPLCTSVCSELLSPDHTPLSVLSSTSIQ